MSGQTSVQPYRPAPTPSMSDTVNLLTGMRDFQAKQATADAYQQSIDPQTGAFDSGKFNALLAASPQGAWNIGPSMQQAGQAQSAQGVGTQQQVAAARAQLQGISSYLTPQMTTILNGGTVTGQDMLNAAQRAQDGGFATPEMVANVQKQVAGIGGPTGNANDIVRGAFFGTQAGLEQLKTIAPPVQPVGLGSTVQPFQPSPLAAGGAGFTGRGVGAATSMTPYQAIVPLDIRMSNGSIQQVLPANVPAFLGQNPGASVIGPSQSAPAAAAPIAAAPGGGTPARPVAATPPPAAAAPTLTVGAPPKPSVGVSPPLGAEAAASGVSTQSTAMGASAGASPQRQAILSDMESALSGPHPLNTGPYADWAANWSALVNRLPDGLSSLIPGMTKEQVAGQEGFVKMAEQLRQLQGQQISGALTNDKFASALASSPHLALSTLGNAGMIHILQGNEDAITAKNNAWQQSLNEGWQPAQFQTWQTAFNKTALADPRIYWLAHMDYGERTKLIQGMAPAQRVTLDRNLAAAVKGGILDPSQFAHPPGQ
jgi:hypothetical protein